MSEKDYTRRAFLGKITTATLSAVTAGLLPGRAEAEATGGRQDLGEKLQKGSVILFQGDSITDAGRNRKELKPNVRSGLGSGYVYLASAHLRHVLAAYDLKIYNRGVSGDKVYQMSDRWRQDCLQLKPDLLSVLIGVNDFWHTLDFGYKGTAESYEEDFRTLLTRTRQALPDVQFIIGEPFFLKEGSAIVAESWIPEFYRYQKAAKTIAREFGAAFIPYQSVFDEASNEVPATYWAEDGVHPTLAGCHLMAQAWLETVKRL